MQEKELRSDASFTQRLKHGVTDQGANPIRILADIATLGRRPNRLQASEYFLYQHWDDKRFDDEAKQTFLGANAKQRIDAPWINAWPQLAQDKLTIDTLLRGFEVPVAETQAIFHHWGFPGAEQLATGEDISSFLRERARYPLFCKSACRRSDTAPVAIESFEQSTGDLQLGDGTAVPLDQFVDQISVADQKRESGSSAGYLFQTRLQAHPELVNVTGQRVSTVRFVCFTDAESVELLRATWKIPCGKNITDSARLAGNLLAGVDVETGVVTHVVQPDPLKCERMDHHPDSGISFTGLLFPEWQAMCDIVIKAAAAVPNCFVQGWDVALCEQGPVIIELHAGGGDPMLTQLGASTGLLSGKYAKFAKLALAHKSKRRSYWDELKRNTLDQMSNLKVRPTAESESEPSAGESPAAAQDKSKEGQEFHLDSDAKTDFSFAERMLHAVSQHGANPMTLVSDIARLSRRPNRLPPYEYFLYQLWDDERFDAAAKHTFLGSDGWVRINKAMRNRWPDLAEDKLAISAILRAHAIEIPETQAIYHQVRRFPGAAQLTTKDDVLAFLRDQARYPLFGKPVGSQLSLGAVAIEAYVRESNELQLSDGTSVSALAFIEQITAADQDPEACRNLQLNAGYLFQTKLRPHPELAKVVGQRTGTVRMICLSDDQGVELIRASWKIPGGDNVADNLWRRGNMLAGIDLESGALTHVVQPGPLEYQNVTEHADSGVSFEGMVFPQWQAMREVVQRAAAATPDCPFQGWDVALCEQGPVVLELQAGGGNPVLAQLGYAQGLLTGRYARYVARIVGKRRGVSAAEVEHASDSSDAIDARI